MNRHFIIDIPTLCRNRNHDLGSRGYRGEKCCLMADKVIGSWLENFHSWQPNPVHPLVPTGCALNVGMNSSQSHRNSIKCLLQGEGLCDSCGQGCIHPPGHCSGVHSALVTVHSSGTEKDLGTSWWGTCSTPRGSLLALGVQSWALQQPCCPPGVYQCQEKRTDRSPF